MALDDINSSAYHALSHFAKGMIWSECVYVDRDAWILDKYKGQLRGNILVLPLSWWSASASASTIAIASRSMATDSVVIGAFNPVEGKVTDVPTHEAINEKIQFSANDSKIGKDGEIDSEIKPIPPSYDSEDQDKDDGEEHIIITGADASNHLLPLRDDHDAALTFRGMFLATILSGFQASMYQIYNVSW